MLLNDREAQKRSVAARILGERKFRESITFLILRLSKEKSLYTKIETSEALVKFGTHAISELIGYIGKVGKNQHKKLPEDIFIKKNYPLPRDIIIRTIIKMGNSTFYYLKPFLISKSPSFLSEVVDAIGYITFYTKDYSLLNDLLILFDFSEGLEVLRWKIIRAFQSFPNEKVVNRLEVIFRKSSIPAHRWEAVRSLAQINNKKTKALIKEALLDSNPIVAKMAKQTLSWNINRKNC